MTCLFRWSLVVSALLVGLCLTGCKAGKRSTNFSHIKFETGPRIQSQSDPAAEFGRYRTFALDEKMASSDPLVAKHLELVAGSMFEAIGYEYVDSGPADLVVSLSSGNEYQATRIPGQRVKVEIPVEDGLDETEYVNIAGTTTTAFYPEVHVIVFDAERIRAGAGRDACIWSGTAAASSEAPDIRLTGQMLLLHLLKEFAVCAEAERPERDFGITWAVLSPDAKVFRPALVLVDRDSRADRAGLRQWDMVEAMDGVSTEGLDLPAVRDLLPGADADTVTFTVRRVGETSEVIVTRPQPLKKATINATW